MEQIFSIKSQKVHEWIPKGDYNVLCALCDDTLAFTSAQDLKLKAQNPDSPKPIEDATTISLYVCDILEPWHLFLINRRCENIIHLIWSSNSPNQKRLLVADESGKIEVWQRKQTMTHVLLNDWTCTHSVNLSGEIIVCAKWFQNGAERNIKLWREIIGLYDDKYPKIDCKCTVEELQSPGEGADGFCVITSSGLFAWAVISKVNSDVYVEKHSLFQNCRSYIAVADINFHIDSSFVVAVSDGCSTSPISTYKVQISSQNSAYSTSISSGLGIVLQDNSSEISVTHLKFTCRFSLNDELIVVTEQDKRSKVTFLKLDKEVSNLHPAILNASHGNMPLKFEESCWISLAEFMCNSLVMSIAAPHRYGDRSDVNNSFEQVVISESNGAVHLFSLKDWQLSCSSDHFEKYDYDKCLSCVDQSYNGTVFVGLDRYGTITCYKVTNTRDSSFPLSSFCISSMLEYCLLREKDSWDVMCCLKSPNAEAIWKQINDNFYRQLKPVQDYFAVSILMLNVRIQKVLSTSNSRPADYYLEALLTHYWYLFSRKLHLRRPTQMMERVKLQKMIEILSSTIENSRELDPNNLVSLKEIELRQDVFTTCLPSLEFVCQLAIQVFFEVANMSNYLVSIHRNPGALCKLRCLIFVIRNSIKSNFEPPLLRKGVQTQRDGLGRIYTLLTKLWMVRIEKDAECDENLLNDMSLIHAHFLTHPPQVPQTLTSRDFIYQGNASNNFHYGEEPEIKNATNLSSLQRPKQEYDCITQMALGCISTKSTRQCTRCGGLSYYSPTEQKSSQYTCTRWRCLCGGQWRCF